jgi:hypothetical protein
LPKEQILRHFIQYHNPSKYGPPGDHTPGEPYWIATRKNPFRLPENCVWVVLGEGLPREYVLFEVFIAETIRPAEDVDFLYYIGGLQGLRFEPQILLNPIPWFQQMKRSLGNFSLGLTEITGSYAGRLIALAQANSQKYREMECF